MGTRLKQTALIVPAVALCLITIPSAAAVVSETMGNITFQCDDGWEIHGPYCYLLVDQPMTFEDADEICEKYGSDVVKITDEVEAKEVGKMVQKHNQQWGFYWIGNTQKRAVDACEGLWDVGEPKDVDIRSITNVAANAPHGRWKSQDKTSRLPVVCKTDACVRGTFRCKDGGKCIRDSLACDGVGDCDDHSDESDCASYYTWYHRESSGTLNKNSSYDAGKIYTWYLEGIPGMPMSIRFTSLNVEADVDYVEVWSGGPSLMKSRLQERLTGSLADKLVYGYNNFLIVRLIADLSIQRTGFVATWFQDPELSQRNREITATNDWTELTSPYYYNDPSPLAYIRHYSVTTEEGSFITMEVLKNELENGFEYDTETRARVNDVNIFPDTFVSSSNTFSFYLVANRRKVPEKFKARVKKGCSADLTGANGFVRPPLFDSSTAYPPSVTCTYVIRAPEGAQRAFQLYFNNSQLADAADSVKVYDGGNSSSRELTPSGGYKGNNPIPSTTFRSSGPVVFVEFTSSMVLTKGFFELIFDLACPAITDTDNMMVSSKETHYGSEVTLSCNTGYAFAQEEFANEMETVIRCDLGGKWNIRRLPTCQIIYCWVPEPISYGIISNGSGDTRYNATVTYQCWSNFSMTGSDTITCGDGFAWSTRPTCHGSCPSLGSLANGKITRVTGNGADVGTIVNYTCDAGYNLVGSRYSVCQTNSTWSHVAPTCLRIQCPIPEVAMATLTPATEPVKFGSLLKVMCPNGYVINGTSDASKTYPCLTSGHFDVSFNVCVDEDECAATAIPCDTGRHEVCVNTEGSYRCVCADKYRNNSAGATCEVIDQCAEGTSWCDPEHGYCNSTNNGEDYICGCNSGYTLFTEDGLNGHYIPSNETGMTPGDVYYLNHTCVLVRCTNLPKAPLHGQALTQKNSSDFFYFGDSVEYRCDFGYTLTTDTLSSNVLMCDASSASDTTGSFDVTAATCSAITCEALTATGLVANIYPNSTTNAGDQVLLECYSETGPRYNKTLYCAYDNKTDTFRLQGDTPHCPAIDCGSIKPTGGANFTAPTNTSFGSSFTFTCVEHSELEGMSSAGNDVVTCQKNGRWGLGNLTCTGPRCSDPGTPGGMTQIAANFDLGGNVVYSCKREGFMPNPSVRRCVYNTITNTSYWNGNIPVCEDVEDPVFTVCPTSPIKLKLYGMAGSEMAEPKATDNSGLVTITVSPSWFHRDTRLAGSLNVTYTAKDDAGRIATCNVTIEVKDPAVLPALRCPDYLTLEVNSSMTYDITLADHVTADSSIMLTYSSGPVLTVGPGTVGETAVRVTATDMYDFERQCAFVVEIRPIVCLSTYIVSNASARNSSVNCQDGGDGVLNCTVTCLDNFAFQDGTTTMSYDCHGANEWSPALPARSCVQTTAAKYLYMVNVTYSFMNSTISNCQTSLTTKLKEVIPTQSVLTCEFDGGNQNITFLVTDVKYDSIQNQSMIATIKLFVTNDLAQLTKTDFEACAPRFSDDRYTKTFFGKSAASVDCGTSGVHDLTPGGSSLVRHGWFCSNEYIMKNVEGTHKCVACEPGKFKYGNVCVGCADGQYQNQSGQTPCKTSSCPAGFKNGQGLTALCIACAEDFYLATPSTDSCVPCPNGTTTSGVTGATKASACKAKCPAGQYPVNKTNCAPCPMGYYKATVGNVACTPCNPNATTNSTGSSSSSDCESISPPTCQNGGTGRVDYHERYCDCPVGYYGDRCQNTIDACGSSPCYNGGTCTANRHSSYDCSCPYGFSGDRCESDLIDNCANNTCASASFCRDLIGTADCVCPSQMQYTEPECEINLDLCGNNPCQNGGACVDSGNGVRYTCICQPGYTGDNCETDINECDANPDGCLFGGTCNNLKNGYSCNCGTNGGDHCQILPDFCTLYPNFCANGVCYNDYNIWSAVCVCHFPYRKDADGRCKEIDICAENNPCEHNSTCNKKSPGVARCQCLAGYTGSHCQHNIDDCNPNPCVHGKCKDLVNGYSCDCDPGYNGTKCDQNINDCPGNCNATNTEPNGCDDLVQDYRCRCKVGFTGKDCEINIDECRSLPCQHNGTCTQSTTPGQYTCSCVNGWTGQNCESLPQLCSDSACDNGGQCFSLQDNFFCKCASGTRGQTCTVQTSDFCETVNPCTSASTCQRGDKTAICNCPADYTGSSCNLIKDGCSSAPCQNGGTCITHTIGYTCQCAEGYGGDDCSTEVSVCDSANCPSGSQCNEVDNMAICLCSAMQQRSGDSCKDMSNNFDIYFTKRGNAIRSSQPFRMTENSLTLMFWIAPLAESGNYPVQLRLSNGTTFLAVNKENITFGHEDPVRLEDTSKILTGFTDGLWNQFAVTWNGSHYDLYLNGIDLAGGVTAAGFPSQNELVFIYIGADFKGYISQVTVWGRVMPLRTEALSMFDNPLNSSNQSLLARWSDYHLSDNIWAQVIHPSIARTYQPVCDNGQSGSAACSSQQPDKEPPTVNNCPEEISAEAERLVQVNDHIPGDMFTGAASIVSNMNRTLLTFGAHRLVYMASDEHNNVALCRINAYIKRQGQSCNNTEGLDTVRISDCMSKGQRVQCPNNGKAPLSPQILTCGKLGSYNLDNWYQLPPAVMCGASEDLKYQLTLTLKYKLLPSCNSAAEISVKNAIIQKVKELQSDWTTLCGNGICDDVNYSAKCEEATHNFITATVIIGAVPSSLTHRVTNVFLRATLERSAFDIQDVFSAELQKNVVEILAEKSCDAGFGLHVDGCVECTQGSFLNEITDRCQLCPIGSFTDTTNQTACTHCPEGQTTLQLGATQCNEECAPGKYFDLSDNQCKDCMKNFYQNETGQLACIPCPPGKVTESTGANSTDLCYDICVAGTERNNFVCVPCPRGKYRDGIREEACLDCPAGNTTAGNQSTSITQCNQPACEPGHFRNSLTNMCEECDYGFYQPEQWQDMCLKCMDNHSTMNKASTNASQCLLVCGPGEQFNSSMMRCVPCPLGTWNTGNDTQRFEQCAPCPDGFVTVNEMTGATSIDNCTQIFCGAGYEQTPGNETCQLCQEDFIKAASGPHRCTQCTGNYTANAARTVCDVLFCDRGFKINAENTSCDACEVGLYKPQRGTSDMCVACPTNTTTASVASTNESDCNRAYCAPGFYSPHGTLLCVACPLGKFKNMTGNQNCTACYDGFTTADVASTAPSQCSLADCKPGSFRYPIVGCQECPKGQYQPQKHQTSCIPCDRNLTTYTTGSISNDSCIIQCMNGKEYDIITKGCSPCRIGYYRLAAETEGCVKCPDKHTTLREGESTCVKEPEGMPPRPVQRRTIRIGIRFRIRSCTNKGLAGNIIIQFITNIVLRLGHRFPAVCRNSCENLVITFNAGCLQGFHRGRRQTPYQEVELTLTGVNGEVRNNDTNLIYDSLTIVKNAFIDVPTKAKELNQSKIDFVGVTSAAYTIECQPGEYISGTECKPCAPGTFCNHTQCSMCTPCDVNTYQNSIGQSNCTDCPLKTYTTTGGSTSASDCRKMCDEPNSKKTYCSGHGTCVFDASTSNGVQCVCDDKYSGNNCASRLDIRDDTTIITGAAVGATSGFLLLMLLITGIVVCWRRCGKKKNLYMDNTRLSRHKDSIPRTYPNDNFPMHESMQPAITYMNPVAEEDISNVYIADHSTALSSRPQSQRYESELRTFQGTL